MSSGWIARLKSHGTVRVGAALGIREGRGRRLHPCPACGREKLSDGRPPVVTGDRGGWECQSCKESGDAVDLVSFRVLGRRLRDVGGDELGQVLDEAVRLGLVDDDRDERPHRTARPVPSASAALSPARTVVYRSARGGPPVVAVESGDDDATGDSGRRRVSGRDFKWDDALVEEAIARLWSDDGAAVLRYLRAGAGELPGGADGRRFPDEAIRVWKLGAWRHPDGGWWVTIPILDPRTGSPVNVKFRRVPGDDGETPKPKYMTCPGRPLTLFGARALPDDVTDPVLIVEGELDVVSLWCYGYEQGVVSGTSGAGSWEDSWLDALEPYSEFTVVYDDDEAGQEGKGKQRVIDALGKDRCATAVLPRKDAGACWLDGVPVEEVDRAIAVARPVVGLQLIRVADEIREFRARSRAGNTATKVYPTHCAPLDELFGGWPCGLTVITGYPGRGKTSAAAWCGVEQARHGVGTCLTSFEQGKDGILAKVSRQFLGKEIERATDDEVDRMIRTLDRMPLIMADRDGPADFQELYWSIRYSIRRQGVRVWVIDHLGYLINHRSRVSEVAQIDTIVQELATIGRTEQVAILLLAHVRANSDRYQHGKESRPRIGQLRGSSSIEGEAALGLVIDKTTLNRTKEYAGDPAAVFYNDKQRGERGAGEGRTTLYFDPVSCLYSPKWELLPCSRGPDDPLPAPSVVTPSSPGNFSTRSARSARSVKPGEIPF